MTATRALLAAAEEQLPEDVGKAPPIGLLLIVVLLIAVALLVKSMTTHLKRIPPCFEPQDDVGPVPDDASELVDPGPQPGEILLDSLRRAPRAIEPPRETTTAGRTPRDGADRSGRRRLALPAVGDVDHHARGLVPSWRRRSG